MQTDKHSAIEKILDSVDHVRKVPAPDFFYTRLKARMDREAGTSPASPKYWILRPVYVVTALVVILLINAFVFLQSSSMNMNGGIPEDENLQSIAAEYNIGDGISEEVYK